MDDSFRAETPVENSIEIHPKINRAEKIEMLKQKDAVFRKRMDQFQIYKNIKKAPQFDDEKKVSEMNIPKTLKNRDLKEIMRVVEIHKNYKPNPYTNQIKLLNDEVKKFCSEQIKNNHIYEGKPKPTQVKSVSSLIVSNNTINNLNS